MDYSFHPVSTEFMKRVGYIFTPDMEIPKNCAIFLLCQHTLHSSRVIDRCNWWGLRNSIMGCHMQQEVLFIRLFHPLTILPKFHFCDITVWNILDLLPFYSTTDCQAFLQTAVHGYHSENFVCVLLYFKGLGGGLPLKKKLTLLF